LFNNTLQVSFQFRKNWRTKILLYII